MGSIVQGGGVTARVAYRPNNCGRHQWRVFYWTPRRQWRCLHNSELAARRCVTATLNQAARRLG